MSNKLVVVSSTLTYKQPAVPHDFELDDRAAVVVAAAATRLALYLPAIRVLLYIMLIAAAE